jgi:phosphatidylinositol alpha-1,6-mannosyltransferase
MLSETQPDGDTEGFGIAILEANYFGKPAIGAKGCGIDDAIKDGFNGRLVDGGKPEEVAEALKDIMENYTAYSARAKKWALRHDWKILIDQFISVKDIPVLTNIKYEV